MLHIFVTVFVTERESKREREREYEKHKQRERDTERWTIIREIVSLKSLCVTLEKVIHEKDTSEYTQHTECVHGEMV